MRFWQHLLKQGAPAAAAHRYWRIAISSHGGSSFGKGFCEISLREKITSALLTSPSTPVLASSVLSGYPAGYAIDGSLTTPWLAPAAGLQWLRLDLSTPRDVGRVEIYCDPYYRFEAPYAFLIQSSNDGTIFVDRGSYTAASWSANPGQIFTVS